MNWLFRNSRFIFLILAIFLALPVPFALIGGLMWLSPFLLLNTVLASKTFVLLNLLGLAVLILLPFKRRLICRYICPLGVVCDQVSKIASKKKKLPVLKNLNKPLALFTIAFAIFGVPFFVVLDPFYIFQVSFEAVRTGINLASVLKLLPLVFILSINLLYPNSWCTNLCPLGGLQLMAADLKNSLARKSEISPKKGRRLFISSLAGLSFGLATPSLLKKERETTQIRPPSALPDSDYFLTCIRCGSCISACPTNILYQQTDVNLLAFLSPAVDFSESYCLPDCTRCGDVCPSGALRKFTISEKKHMVMATVHVDHEKCLLYQQKECQQCRQFCDYAAISYQIQEPYITPIAVIDNEKCVGCAACKIVCPENAIHLDPGS